MARGYVEIPEAYLLPYADEIAPEGNISFVHDHAPIYDAHIVEEFFENHPYITQIYWPGKFMDCNPIENLFGHIVLEWKNADERHPAALIIHVHQVWDRLRADGAICQ